MKTITTFAFLSLFLCYISVARADTFGSLSNTFDIEFVTVGNPGNADDTTGDPNPAGKVDYAYRMGKFEVSEDMITKYNAAFGTANGLAITKDTRGTNKPATSVSWNEAARFVNWLNTSTGGTAAYKFTTGGVNDNIALWTVADTLDYDAANPFRSIRTNYVLPSTDEWYKAAYYNNFTGMYGDYPSLNGLVPTAVASGTADNTAVYGQSKATGPADVTQAGGLSAYGIMGLGGNVIEWEETENDLVNDSGLFARGWRGGRWSLDSSYLSASDRYSYIPSGEIVSGVGFRVVSLSSSVPEPTAAMFLCGSGALACLRRRRKQAKTAHYRELKSQSIVGGMMRISILLVMVLVAVVLTGQLNAATVGVASAELDPIDNDLIGFVTRSGGVYTQSDLIQPTLTKFSGDFARNILVGSDGDVPAVGTRSLLLTHDFSLDTGITNFSYGATVAALQFSPGLINGPGPDLVMFEYGVSLDNPRNPDDFQMRINGVTVDYLGETYNDLLLDSNLDTKGYFADAGTPENIFQLENDSFSVFNSFFASVNGIAIDLDDFGVAPHGMVSNIGFGSQGNSSFDPVLFMGIRSAAVPEPNSLAILAIGAGFGGLRRRKRQVTV